MNILVLFSFPQQNAPYKFQKKQYTLPNKTTAPMTTAATVPGKRQGRLNAQGKKYNKCFLLKLGLKNSPLSVTVSTFPSCMPAKKDTQKNKQTTTVLVFSLNC